MARQRSAWIAARARNASRQGVRIAAMGSIGVLVTLLALVLIPRELDRQVQRRIDALPVAPDSAPLVRALDSLRLALRAVQRDTVVEPAGARLTTALALSPDDVTDSAGRVAVALGTTAAGTPGAPPPPLADSAAIELMARVTRARNAPLADSYRALGDSPLLRGDRRVAALVDSIDLVDREREAHAALGGPGARYAALTAKLTALGQQLVRLAEQRVARSVLQTITAPKPSTSGLATPGVMDSARADSVLRVDSLGRPLISSVAVESAEISAARARLIDSLSQRVTHTDSVLTASRETTVRLAAERSALASRLSATLPPFAMLLAALVIGLAAGYGAVLVREMRRPTVGDLAEVEAITTASVLLRGASSRPSHASSPAHVDRRRRERPGVSAIIDRTSDTFVLLHQSLTGVGDIVTRADVISDDAAVSAAVALSVAAVAAHESRAALVVERAVTTPPLSARLGATPRFTLGDVRAGRARAEEAVHVVPLDRDAHIDVLLAPTDHAAALDASDDEATADRAAVARVDAATWTAVREWGEQYDLRLDLVDARMSSADAPSDLIVCVRQGATSLRWLARVIRQAGLRQQRVRAVLVWGRDVSLRT